VGRFPTYTIADVVRMAGVTERTVRRDIASGLLPSVKLPNGHRRLKLGDIDKYRCSRVLQKPHMKIEELAPLYGMSLRNLRRYLAKNDFPIPIIRASSRRHYVSRAVFQKWAGGKCVVEPLERHALATERERAASRGRRKQTEPTSPSRPSGWGRPYFLRVPEVASLAARRSVRFTTTLRRERWMSCNWFVGVASWCGCAMRRPTLGEAGRAHHDKW